MGFGPVAETQRAEKFPESARVPCQAVPVNHQPEGHRGAFLTSDAGETDSGDAGQSARSLAILRLNSESEHVVNVLPFEHS